MVLLVFTEVSFLPSLVSLSTEVSTSVSVSSLSSPFWTKLIKSDDSIKPVVLVGPLEGSFAASFLLGWGVTTGAGLASYPLDTIRRRMMMTSGGTVHYKSMFDAGSQIVAKEGMKSLFKGAGANILRGVAGAGVLSLYDKMQELMFGKVYSVCCILLIVVIKLIIRVDLDKRDVFYIISRNLPSPQSFTYCLGILIRTFYSFRTRFVCYADVPDSHSRLHVTITQSPRA